MLWHRLVPVPDEPEDTGRRSRWTRAIVSRIRKARGTLLCTVAGTVAASFDAIDLREAMDLAIGLLHAAELEEPPFQVSMGLAAGTVTEADDDPTFPFPTGTAIDRAQLLANRARAGELVVDASVRELADRVYLFSRSVGTGTPGLRGEALDRDHSRREECRTAIRHLAPPPIPPSTADVTARIAETLREGGRHRVLLRGPSGAGAREWVEALVREHDPALLLAASGVPSGLEPLGSLRLALLRRWGTPEGVAAAALAGAVDRVAVATLVRIAEGRAVERNPTVHALRSLLSAHAEDERVWVVLDPLSEVDSATIDAVASATGDGGPAAVVIARLPVDAEAPEMLLHDANVHEVLLPALRHADARAVARAVLGESTDDDVVRRIAVLGGETPLGVVEAARTLIAAGDLVHGPRGFAWRRSPRSGIKGIEVESLIEERLATLDPTRLRVLQAVCIAPSGASAAVLGEVTSSDGIADDALTRAVHALREEALLRVDDPWQPTSEVLRNVVVHAMQPARQSELYRFVADAMTRTSHRDGEFVKATIGWYLAEGGRETEGARALIEAGRAAQLSGFTRAALRLAAAAVQFDDTEQTRAAATMLTRATRRPASFPPRPGPPRTPSYVPPPPVSVVAPAEPDEPADLVQRTIDGIRARDFEATDRLIDIAIAEGRDRGAAERVRALACLARGDLGGATRHLARSRALAADERAVARGALAYALVLLHTGEVRGAVRAALGSLGTSRARRDPRGEAAALHALALCYRAVGRELDAEAVEEASPG